MKSRFLLDVVVREGSSVFKLLSSEDQTLLIRGNAFLVLNLGLDIVDSVGRFDLEGDGLSGQGLFGKDSNQLSIEGNIRLVSSSFPRIHIRDNAYASQQPDNAASEIRGDGDLDVDDEYLGAYDSSTTSTQPPQRRRAGKGMEKTSKK
jgi:hypothetical protein